MSVQKIGLNSSRTSTPHNNKYCDNCASSHIGKIAGFTTGALIGTGLVHSQMKDLKTVSGKKNLLEKFYLDLKDTDNIPKRPTIRNAEGKIVLPSCGVHERSKLIAKSHKNYYTKWGIFITLITTGLGFLADRSITAVNQKEYTEQKSAQKS